MSCFLFCFVLFLTYFKKRGARLIETLHYDFSLQIVFWDHLQIKWRPDPSPVISLYFPCLTKVKSGRDLHARGAEWKGGIRKSFPVLFTFSFPSFLSQQESCFNQQERTLVTHSSTARVSRFCFYHFLTSSVIYYWTDPGQHGIYRTIPKISSEGYLYLKVPFLRGLFLEGRIFGDPYIQRDLFVSKSARLIYYWLVGKYASQNPCVGLAYSWKEIYVGNLQQLFTETRLGDVDLSKTQPCKYFVFMDQGNPSHKNSNILWHFSTAIIWHT